MKLFVDNLKEILTAGLPYGWWKTNTAKELAALSFCVVIVFCLTVLITWGII